MKLDEELKIAEIKLNALRKIISDKCPKGFLHEILNLIEQGITCSREIVRFKSDYYYENKDDLNNFFQQKKIVDELKLEQSKRNNFYQQEHLKNQFKDTWYDDISTIS